MGTEQREARLSELTEGSADISAWFEGIGEEGLGLEEPRGREGAAPQGAARLDGSPQGAAARPLREGIAMLAMMIWRRGRRSDSVGRERRERKGEKKTSCGEGGYQFSRTVRGGRRRYLPMREGCGEGGAEWREGTRGAGTRRRS